MDSYYEQVAQAFDRAAQSYDEEYRANRMMAWLRAESLAALQATFPPGSYLLELGCGTGEEALALSRAGYRIVATDVSPTMIEVARAKAQAAGAEGVAFYVLPAGQLPELARDYERGAFDGAYSSFGALNCEDRLAAVATALAHLLRPEAALVCSVMNRWCAWEMAWGTVHLRPGEAFRRLGRGWVDAGLASSEGRLSVPTQYYRPGTFARAFAPHFRLQAVRALPVLLPPPYLDHLVARHPTLFARLAAAERHLRDWFPFHSLGDHFLVTMVRTQSGEPPC